MINNKFEILKQPSSIAINSTILSSQQPVDKEALEIILFATEGGLGCRETAEDIAAIIKHSINLNQDFFDIIKELIASDYFFPTPQIAGLVDTYLTRVGDIFEAPEDDFEIDEFREISPEEKEECYGF